MLKKIPALFQKIEVTKEEPSTGGNSEQTGGTQPSYITIDDVIKVELRVGTIRTCEPMPKSDKLLRMEVDFGELGQRQILGGIAKFYTPEQLIGTQGIFVFNLKPRKMMGLESQGMMLLAKADDGTMKMATVAAPVPDGTRLQ